MGVVNQAREFIEITDYGDGVSRRYRRKKKKIPKKDRSRNRNMEKNRDDGRSSQVYQETIRDQGSCSVAEEKKSGKIYVFSNGSRLG
ncbi:hypothetical protein PNOK_0658200 [Pyrrhoderma noxium]|uniref:Uncharacterized protein n=1 Tax=Pyrrhoderma noxium TaxID=2282107 RepID=A0A286UER3_9AGAM|nr:hypothetical protein PNOK_0658200 [Pyrrhoderma noxium]